MGRQRMIHVQAGSHRTKQADYFQFYSIVNFCILIKLDWLSCNTQNELLNGKVHFKFLLL